MIANEAVSCENRSQISGSCLLVFSPGRFIGLAATALLWFGAGNAAAAERSGAGGAPIVLSDRQLDFVTAGESKLELDLSAAAQGPTATAITSGTSQSAGAKILLIETSSNAHGVTGARLLGTVPATLVLATGKAQASGATAQCSANVVTSGEFAYLTEASLRTAAPGSAGVATTVTCACAALAIALGPH